MSHFDELHFTPAAHLVAVAHYGGFSQAGQAIGLSQSAVSHSIKELEAVTGVRLLDRTTREVMLTEAGQQLASRMASLLEEMNSTLLDIRSYGEQRSGTVRIAASQTISAHLMPQCLAASQQSYPDIRIILHDRVQEMVLQSVRNAEVDFGIVIGPLNDSDLDCQAILDEPFCCYAAATIRSPGWIKRSGVCWRDALWCCRTTLLAVGC